MKAVKFSTLSVGDKFKLNETCEAVDVKIEPVDVKIEPVERYNAQCALYLSRYNAQCVDHAVRHFVADARIVFVEEEAE